MTAPNKKIDSKDNSLVDLCISQLSNSYSPYSNFKVSAVITTTSGLNYTGVNVENASYSLALCAEASAIAQMITSCGQTLPKIKQVIVVNDTKNPCPPCGSCLQRLLEFSDSETEVIVSNSDRSNVRTFKLNDLLPVQFNSDFLS
jgi:cytidine deaminase